MNGTPATARTLARISRHLRFGGTVIGICTGAITLARAGVLTGKRFTLHWENQPAFRERFFGLTPTERKFEKDGKVLTSGGGAAATDLMMSVIGDDFGDDFVLMVADMCLHRADTVAGTTQRSSLGASIGCRNPSVVNAVKMMQANIETPSGNSRIRAGLRVRRIRSFRILVPRPVRHPAFKDAVIKAARRRRSLAAPVLPDRCPDPGLFVGVEQRHRIDENPARQFAHDRYIRRCGLEGETTQQQDEKQEHQAAHRLAVDHLTDPRQDQTGGEDKIGMDRGLGHAMSCDVAAMISARSAVNLPSKGAILSAARGTCPTSASRKIR
jgi:hypothetical protein